jgi:hypothetical protein
MIQFVFDARLIIGPARSGDSCQSLIDRGDHVDATKRSTARVPLKMTNAKLLGICLFNYFRWFNAKKRS